MEAKQIISALQAYKFIQEHSWLHKMEFQLNAIQPWAYIQQITIKQKWSLNSESSQVSALEEA